MLGRKKHSKNRGFFRISNIFTKIKTVSYTKSRLLLDCSRGAQRVSPVCVGVLLGYDGQGAKKQTSLRMAETAVPPFFSASKSNFKGTMV